MSGQNQDDIDALLGNLPNDSEADGSPADATSAPDDPFSSFGDHDTGESPEVQAEESEAASPPPEPAATGTTAKGRAGIPWVDYIPVDPRPKPRTLQERLDRRIIDTDAELAEREQLVRTWYIEGKVHLSYYKHWILNSNLLFRNEVILKQRRKALKKAAPPDASPVGPTGTSKPAA